MCCMEVYNCRVLNHFYRRCHCQKTSSQAKSSSSSRHRCEDEGCYSTLSWSNGSQDEIGVRMKRWKDRPLLAHEVLLHRDVEAMIDHDASNKADVQARGHFASSRHRHHHRHFDSAQGISDRDRRDR